MVFANSKLPLPQDILKFIIPSILVLFQSQQFFLKIQRSSSLSLPSQETRHTISPAPVPTPTPPALHYRIKNTVHLPSSRRVNLPIWGKSAKVSIHTIPAVWNLAKHIWSCFTNLNKKCSSCWIEISTRLAPDDLNTISPGINLSLPGMSLTLFSCFLIYKCYYTLWRKQWFVLLTFRLNFYINNPEL